jgi:hypothetical protein
LGVKETVFFPTVAFLRLGDDFIGDEKVCGSTANAGARDGVGGAGRVCFSREIDCFFRFGVPFFVGGNASVMFKVPSGLTTCAAAAEEVFSSLPRMVLA